MKNWYILLLLLLACNSSCFQYEAKKKPKAAEIEQLLPEGAFWVKTTNELGYWFHVNWVHRHRNIVEISIYSGDTKEFLETKSFFLVCPNLPEEPEWIEDLKTQISHYEKNIIYFKASDCMLQKR